MKKEEIAAKFDAKTLTKWTRKKTKKLRDAGRDERIAKWEGKK